MHLYRSSDFSEAIKLLVCKIQTPPYTTQNHMPRLLGKSSKTSLYIGTALAVAVVGAIALEYSGIIDVIPNFGKDQKMMGQSNQKMMGQSKSPVRKVTNIHDEAN
jgi:hypothetical protein